MLSSIATYTVSLTAATENAQAATPGERAITTLLRLVLYPPGMHPNPVGGNGPRLPSFLSGGAPRDRRGRLGQKSLPVTARGVQGDYEDRLVAGGPLHTETMEGIGAGGGGELGLQDDQEREGKELLDSLRSPNLDLTAATAENIEQRAGGESEDDEIGEGEMGTITQGDAMEPLGTGPGGWGPAVGISRPAPEQDGVAGRRAAIYEDQVYEDPDGQLYASAMHATVSRRPSRIGADGEREAQPAQAERKLRI